MLSKSTALIGLFCITSGVALAQTMPERTVSTATPLLGDSRERGATAREERWIFPGQPRQTEWQSVETEEDGRTVDLRRVVDPSSLNDNALGFRVLASSVGGLSVEDISRNDLIASGENAPIAVDVVPPEVEDWSNPPLSGLMVRVHERFPTETERRIENVEVSAGARLEFGFGLFDDLATAILTNQPVYDAYHARRATPVRFEVYAETSAGSDLLFAETYPPSEHYAGEYAWQDRRVDLSPFAGHTIALRFTTARGKTFHDRLAMEWFPLWGEPVLVAPGAETRRPNLILISLDTLRADHLGTYGYSRNTSPNFDRFAAESFLFERCIAPSSWTVPSHVTLFTGLPPSVHTAGMWQGWRLRPEFTTLTELARDSGYVTAAYTDGVAVQASFGLNQGFDRYSDGRKAHFQGRRAEDTFANGQAYIEAYGDVPFFLFLHTYQIHTPYRPPAPYREMFTQDKDNGGVPAPGITDPKERQTYVDLYDGGIAYTDHALGGFLDYLRDSGRLENTVVIIFSDHGEEFWEHGGFMHGKTLYQEQLHVPLLIRLPGGSASTGRVADMVGLIDVYATIAGLLDLNTVPPETSLSLVPLMRDAENPPHFARQAVTSELVSRSKQRYFVSMQSMEDKYILSAPFDDPASVLHGLHNAPLSLQQVGAANNLLESLASSPAPDETKEVWYNLQEDPVEQHPLSLNPDARERLRTESRAATQDFVRIIPPEVLASAPAAELTAEEIATLRALGYVE